MTWHEDHFLHKTWKSSAMREVEAGAGYQDLRQAKQTICHEIVGVICKQTEQKEWTELVQELQNWLKYHD